MNIERQPMPKSVSSGARTKGLSPLIFQGVFVEGAHNFVTSERRSHAVAVLLPTPEECRWYHANFVMGSHYSITSASDERNAEVSSFGFRVAVVRFEEI
jgi:hypothetical protein